MCVVCPKWRDGPQHVGVIGTESWDLVARFEVPNDGRERNRVELSHGCTKLELSDWDVKRLLVNLEGN